MPLITITRFFTTLLSWAILAAIIYLGWTWYQGEIVQTEFGAFIRVREDWRLWTLIGLLVWSAVGGMITRQLISGADRRKLNTDRGSGYQISGTDGASIYVETTGIADAPTIILTHGWGLDSTIWGYAKDDLSSRFHVVSWDLPGMGLSKPGTLGITLSGFAESLRQLIETASTGKVILVGHSIGGMATQTLARDLPEFFEAHVAGVVLINTTYTNPLKTMVLSKLALALQKPLIEPIMVLTRWLTPLAWLSGWQSYFNGTAHLANRIGFGPHVTHSQLEHTALLTTRNSPGAQALGNLSMFDWDSGMPLRFVNVPTLIIGGGVDLVTKLEASETMGAAAATSELLTVADANHMGFLERFEMYNEAIANFAGRNTSAADAKIKVGVY